MRLQGKTAAITGAAGDIGNATAWLFHAEGAQLVLIDRDEQALAESSRSFRAGPLTITADVTDEDQVRRAAATARAKFGTIDVLFVNAGIEQSHSPIIDLDKAAFERIVAVNLTGAFVTIKHFMPLIADHGSVIFTSSVAAMMAYPGLAAYSASKAGLIGLMRSSALDVAPRRIRCNAIHPGPVKSKMLERSAQEATGGGDVTAWYDAMAGIARMGRLVEPGDVAALALFLASDDSAMISSQSIVVDGGVM